MIINIFFILVVLSLESTVALPIFSLYLFYNLIKRRSEKFILSSLFIASFFLAIFYSLSWPVLSLLLLIFHLIDQKFNLVLLRFFLFIVFNLLIFQMAKLQLNYFYLVQLPAFLIYFYKANFKKYAA